METQKDSKDKFIEEKLYIPIEKLKDYLGTRDAESFTIVYENGEQCLINCRQRVKYVLQERL